MKIDKEYPATHSMSTSWYVVDDDGNVGIMDYNENGPVPWGIEETCGEELKYGHWEDFQSKKFLGFNLTDEQIYDLLHEGHKPSEETLWFDCVVKIDKKKTDRFLELYRKNDVYKEDALCLSEELGLYSFDAYDCAHDVRGNETSIRGTLKTMLEEELILEVYRIQSFDMGDQCIGGKTVYSKEFDNSPYFMFHQPYCPEELPQKMHEPNHPVSIHQIPEEFRHRLHKIPGRFKDMETFQIAQYYPCDAYANEDPTYVVDGCSYQTSPLPNGGKVFTKTGMCLYPFLPFCSEKERFGCSQKCSWLCCDLYGKEFTDKPTVLLIFDPREEFDYTWTVHTDIVIQKSYVTSYIPKFPYRSGKQFSCLKSDVEEYMTTEYLIKVFQGSKGYIETIINDINPRVILATDKAWGVIKEIYSIDSNSIRMGNKGYPFYSLSLLGENRAVVEKLASLPYQGKEHAQVITMEEMEEFVCSGLAKKYEDIL